MPNENIVVAHRRALCDRLKNQTIGCVRFDRRITADCSARLDLHCYDFQPENALDYRSVHGNRGVTGFTLRRTPIPPAITLVDTDRVLVDIPPPEADQFAD